MFQYINIILSIKIKITILTKKIIYFSYYMFSFKGMSSTSFSKINNVECLIPNIL